MNKILNFVRTNKLIVITKRERQTERDRERERGHNHEYTDVKSLN